MTNCGGNRRIHREQAVTEEEETIEKKKREKKQLHRVGSISNNEEESIYRAPKGSFVSRWSKHEICLLDDMQNKNIGTKSCDINYDEVYILLIKVHKSQGRSNVFCRSAKEPFQGPTTKARAWKINEHEDGITRGLIAFVEESMKGGLKSENEGFEGLVYIRELGIGFDIPNVDLDCKGKISFMSSRGLSFSIAMVA
ncbi:hypothetical protein M9H77_35079 [Catharanthus roseus]|uniref:Uncharacterized protein n=1 Tax=Catharanthus roseus TaxID=4058 RepID=A0ACB9ZNW4_CATRO|nr:hypothetical protein M9H77_35079 [Catharanthus roseus]